MATGLNIASLQNPLPNTSTLGNLVIGISPAQGLGVNFYNQNHIYSPTDGSASSTQLVANGNAIANVQGLATTNLQAIQQRLALLPSLQTSLSSAQSITEVNAINGRIALEANYIQAQQAQAQNLALLAQQQSNSQLQQERESFMKDMTDGEAEMKAAAIANGGQ
jgi:type IV secretion system protein VirB5